jgi:hypothetical protein
MAVIGAEQAPLFPPYSVDKAFTPHRPIELRALLAGRIELIQRALDAVNTDGLHLILFGDRGVGKTSLAKVLAAIVQEPDLPEGSRSIYVTCDSSTSFSSLWSRVAEEIQVAQRSPGFGRVAEKQGRLNLEKEIRTPNEARLFVRSVVPNPTVIFFDEFDRIPSDGDAHRLMADTVKLFSDSGTPCTLVIVGVAESITELVAEHQSITRHVAELKVDPMSVPELSEIIRKGFGGAGMSFEQGLDVKIASLSQGYPHYTHLLGLWAGRAAIKDGRGHVTGGDLDQAIPRSLENATGGVQQEYERAVSSTQPETLYEDVLLACAIAPRDSLGRFRAVDLRQPLQTITGKWYDTGAFQSHLAKFCENSRGPALRRSGQRRNYLWQFTNPQLIPYVKLNGVRKGRIQG